MSIRPYIGRHFFDEMENLVDRAFDRRLLGDFFSPSSSGTCPMDLIEKPEAYLVKADAPGMDKGDIKIEVRGDHMTLSGERKAETHTEQGGFTRYERSQQSFCRSLQLPKDADADRIEAALDKGVLSVTIPRKQIEEGSDVKRIEIK